MKMLKEIKPLLTGRQFSTYSVFTTEKIYNMQYKNTTIAYMWTQLLLDQSA